MASPAVVPAPPRRALYLVHTLAEFPGVQSFVVGEADCTAIEAADAGGYDVHVGPKLVRVPAHKVDHFEQDPRPGFAQEQANEKRKLPSYVVDMHDGSYGCDRCGRLQFRSVHAVKVHYGTQHGDERT